jgi:cytochrome c-type biogenesis protein CcmF
MAILVIGMVGSYMYTVDIPKKCADKPGEKVAVADLDFHYKGLKTTSQGINKDVYSTEFDVYVRGSTRKVGEVAPRIAFYKLQKQQTREVDIIYEPFRDVFIIFQGQDEDGNMHLDIKINPLISFVWAGGTLFIIGVLLALWPRRASPLTK